MKLRIYYGSSCQYKNQKSRQFEKYSYSTFGFESTAALLDVVDEGRVEGNLYARYGLNPTIRAVERKLADIEGGERLLITPRRKGMLP